MRITPRIETDLLGTTFGGGQAPYTGLGVYSSRFTGFETGDPTLDGLDPASNGSFVTSGQRSGRRAYRCTSGQSVRFAYPDIAVYPPSMNATWAFKVESLPAVSTEIIRIEGHGQDGALPNWYDDFRADDPITGFGGPATGPLDPLSGLHYQTMLSLKLYAIAEVRLYSDGSLDLYNPWTAEVYVTSPPLVVAGEWYVIELFYRQESFGLDGGAQTVALRVRHDGGEEIWLTEAPGLEGSSRPWLEGLSDAFLRFGCISGSPIALVADDWMDREAFGSDVLYFPGREPWGPLGWGEQLPTAPRLYLLNATPGAAMLTEPLSVQVPDEERIVGMAALIETSADGTIDPYLDAFLEPRHDPGPFAAGVSWRDVPARIDVPLDLRGGSPTFTQWVAARDWGVHIDVTDGGTISFGGVYVLAVPAYGNYVWNAFPQLIDVAGLGIGSHAETYPPTVATVGPERGLLVPLGEAMLNDRPPEYRDQAWAEVNFFPEFNQVGVTIVGQTFVEDLFEILDLSKVRRLISIARIGPTSPYVRVDGPDGSIFGGLGLSSLWKVTIDPNDFHVTTWLGIGVLDDLRGDLVIPGGQYVRFYDTTSGQPEWHWTLLHGTSGDLRVLEPGGGGVVRL